MRIIRKYAKAWVALGLAAFFGAVNEGTLPEKWQPWGVAAVAVLAALGVRQVPNRPSGPTSTTAR